MCGLEVMQMFPGLAKGKKQHSRMGSHVGNGSSETPSPRATTCSSKAATFNASMVSLATQTSFPAPPS